MQGPGGSWLHSTLLLCVPCMLINFTLINLMLITCWSLQAEAGALYKAQVYPDMIGNHARARGSSRRASPSATVNSVFAAKFDSKFKEAFASNGDKIATMATRPFLLNRHVACCCRY